MIAVKKLADFIFYFICCIVGVILSHLSTLIADNNNNLYYQIVFWILCFLFFPLLYFIYYKIFKPEKIKFINQKNIFIVFFILIVYISSLILYKEITYKEPSATISMFCFIALFIFYIRRVIDNNKNSKIT